MNLSYEENPKEILEELLKYYDIKTLKGYLNSSVRKKQPRQNNYFEVGTKVYFEKYKNESTLKWAKEKVAEELNIEVATVETHIENYRKYLKEEMNKIDNYGKDINTFIDGYIQLFLNNSWSNTEQDYIIPNYRKLKEYFGEYTDELYISHLTVDNIPF